MNMKAETTVYVKGKRKRTEGGSYSGMPYNIVTIEQCDLQRNIVLNDKKKLYFIEPFAKANVSEEKEQPAKPIPASNTTTPKKGGTVTMWYNITDTGERKKMYGITARHVWTTQRMIPSADACAMKDSMTIKTDGWYIDLPEFNCTVADGGRGYNGGYQKPDCMDRYVMKQSGKGKLGFPLVEKRTMIMGNGKAESTTYVTDLETIELSTAKLDSSLFEIPAGYTLAKSRDELQDIPTAADVRTALEGKANEGSDKKINPSDPKRAGVLRIGVYEPQVDESVQRSALQQYLVSTLISDKVEAVAVQSADEAKTFNCDLVLATQVTQIKKANKIGGLLKAVRNNDPSAASSYNIEAQLLLSKLSDGSNFSEQKIAGKFEGSAEEATKKAVGEGGSQLLKKMN